MGDQGKMRKALFNQKLPNILDLLLLLNLTVFIMCSPPGTTARLQWPCDKQLFLITGVVITFVGYDLALSNLCLAVF